MRKNPLIFLLLLFISLISSVSAQTGTVAVGANDPGAQSVAPGDLNLAAMQISVTMAGGNDTITRIEFEDTGTVDALVDISAAKLYLDADNTGTVTNGDTLLGSGAFDKPNGKVRFNLSQAINSGQTLYFLLVVDLAGSAANTETFIPRVRNRGIRFNTAARIPNPGTLGGSTMTMNTAIKTFVIAAGSLNPGAGNEPTGATNVAMTQLTFSVNSTANATITALTFRHGQTGAGSITENVDVTNAKLYEDKDQNGAYTPVTDRLIATYTFSADDQNVAFTGLSEVINTNTTETWLLLYNLAGSAANNETFDADCLLTTNNGDITVTGGHAITYADVLGGNKTISNVGVLTASLGSSTPPASTEGASTTSIEMLQVSLSANSAEDIDITSITFTASGTGDDRAAPTGELGSATVKLYQDLNSDGYLDATDPQIGSGQSYAANNGTVTFSSLSETILAGATENWLLVYDFSSATVGNTFIASLNATGDITATGATTSQSITPSGTFAITGNTKTIGTVGTVTAAIGASTPGAHTELNNQQNVEMLQIKLTANGVEQVELRKLNFWASGTGHDVNDLNATGGVVLYVDEDANGLLDTSVDTVYSTEFYRADDGEFRKGGKIFIDPGQTVHLLLVHNYAGTAANGKTFKTRLVTFDARGVTSGGQVNHAGSLPLYGSLCTIGSAATDTTLQVAAGGNNPGNSQVPNDQSSLPVLQFSLQVGSVGDAEVTSITFDPVGSTTANEQFDISAVKLWKDVNGNGTVETGTDTQIWTTGTFAADNGSITFSGAAQTITAGTVENWLVTYDLNGTASNNETLQLQLASAAKISARDKSSTNAITPTGSFAIQGGLKTISSVGVLTLSAGTANPSTRNVGASDTNLVQVQVNLAANSAENIEISSITFTAAGTGDDRAAPTGEIASATVKLYRDLNNNGAYDSTVDTQIGSAGNFSADNGTITFSSLTEVIPAAASKDWILVYDLSAAAIGNTFIAKIANNADVTATGSTSTQAITPIGAPVSGGTATVSNIGALTIAIGPNNPPAQNVVSGAIGVVVMQVALTASSTEDIRFYNNSPNGRRAEARLLGSGSGNDQTDITSCKLYLDANGDGLVDGGDTLLESGFTYNGDNKDLKFTDTAGGSWDYGTSPTTSVITAGSTIYWLLVYDFNGGATNGETYRASLAQFDRVRRMYGPTSGADINQFTGAPVTSNLVTISNTGSLSLATGTQNTKTPNGPGDETVTEGSTNVELLQFDLTASATEAVDITSVVVNFTGTADDLNDISSVSLYIDNGATAGTFDVTDTVIKTGQTISADNGIVTFSGLTEQIIAGATETWLVVANFNTNAENAQTVQASISSGTNITAAGATSTNTIVPSGAPTTGGWKTIEATGTLVLAAGTNNPGATNEPTAEPDVEMVQLKLTAGPNENVKVTQIVVDALAQSGQDNTDIADVSLYNDVNLNGIFEAGTDSAIATAGTYAADAGTVTFSALTEIITAGAYEEWLVVYDFNTNATNLEQYQTQIATTNITAEGNATTNAITTTGVTAQGGIKTITSDGTLTCAIGSSTPPAANEASAASGVELIQVTLTADAVENITVSSIKFTDAGSNSGNMATELAAARLYNDTNGNGVLDGDPQIGGLGTLSGTGITFSGLTEVVDAGTSENWLLVVDFSASATNPDTFIGTVNVAGDIDVSTSTANAVAGTFAVTGNTISISSTPTLTVSLGAENPAAGNVANDEFDVEMLQLSMSASSAGDVTVTAITLTASGTANDLTDITGSSIELYEDNGTTLGILDGTDTLIKGSGSYSADNGTVTFSGFSKTITASSSQKWLLVCDLVGSASGGETFIAEVNASGNVTISTGNIAGTFPVQGNAMTISSTGTLTVAAGDTNPAAASHANNATDVEVFQIKLIASSAENIDISSITFTASGTIDDRNAAAGGDLANSGVALYRDTDNDGVYTSGTDVSIGTAGNYSANNGTITFSGLTESITASSSEHWLLVYSLGGTAANAETFISSINGTGNITATGATSALPITPSGTFPLTGNTMTVSSVGQLTIAAGTNNPGAATISNSDTDVEILQVALSANSTENIDITAITFTALGTADDRNTTAGGDLADAGVRLYLDANNNGIYESGTDTLIGTAGNYSANNGTISFSSLTESITAGATENWLLVYDLAGSAAAGETFIGKIADNTALTATGQTSSQSITPSGAPITGSTMTITANAVLTVSAGTNNPGNTNEINTVTNLEVIQVKLTASNSGSTVDITAITFTASGTGDDRNAAAGGDLTNSSVTLYQDVNSNGVYDSGTDTQIGTAGNYSANNGTIAFSGLTEVISNNSTENWLLVISLGGTASSGETFISKLQTPTTDITATETGPAPALTISGSTVTGGTKTITAVTAVTWDGSSSTLWNVASNWDLNTVPGSSIDVTIPDAATTPNDPAVNAAGQAKTLTLQTSGILSVSSGNSLTINANSTFSGAFTLNSNTTLTMTSAVTLTANASSTFTATGTSWAAGNYITVSSPGAGQYCTLNLGGTISLDYVRFDYPASNGLTLSGSGGATVSASNVRLYNVAAGGTYLLISGTDWNDYQFSGWGFQDLGGAEKTGEITSAGKVLMKSYSSGAGWDSGQTTVINTSGKILWSATSAFVSSFTGELLEESMTLRWSTESELNNAGFRIYRRLLKKLPKTKLKFRADKPGQEWTLINEKLISGAFGSVTRQNYSFVDTSAEEGKIYAYALTSIDLGGNANLETMPIIVLQKNKGKNKDKLTIPLTGSINRKNPTPPAAVTITNIAPLKTAAAIVASSHSTFIRPELLVYAGTIMLLMTGCLYFYRKRSPRVKKAMLAVSGVVVIALASILIAAFLANHNIKTMAGFNQALSNFLLLENTDYADLARTVTKYSQREEKSSCKTALQDKGSLNPGVTAIARNGSKSASFASKNQDEKTQLNGQNLVAMASEKAEEKQTQSKKNTQKNSRKTITLTAQKRTLSAPDRGIGEPGEFTPPSYQDNPQEIAGEKTQEENSENDDFSSPENDKLTSNTTDPGSEDNKNSKPLTALRKPRSSIFKRKAKDKQITSNPGKKNKAKTANIKNISKTVSSTSTPSSSSTVTAIVPAAKKVVIKKSAPTKKYGVWKLWEKTSTVVAEIRTSASGLRLLSPTVLQAQGFDLKKRFMLTNRSQDIPLWRIHLNPGYGAQDDEPWQLCFYAAEYKSVYTKENVYYLWQKTDKLQKVTTLDSFTSSLQPLNSYEAVSRYEVNTRYMGNLPQGTAEEDHFFSPVLLMGTNSVNFTLTCKDVITNQPGRIKLNLRSYASTSPSAHIKITINGTEVGEYSWNKARINLIEAVIPANTIMEGNNTITLTGFDTPATIDLVLTDWIEIYYKRNLKANGGKVKISHGSGNNLARVNGFVTDYVLAVEATDAYNPVLLNKVTITDLGGSYQAEFKVNAGKVYEAEEVSNITTATPVLKAKPSNPDESSCDYLIISTNALKTAAQGFADLHQGTLTNQVFSLEETLLVGDWGRYSPDAIKNLAKMLKAKYLLLVGDMTIDYFKVYGNDVDYSLPAKFVVTQDYHSVSDYYYSSLGGNTPVVAVGRIPVRSATELATVLNKVTASENSTPQTYAIVAAADKDDNLFTESADKAVNLVTGASVKAYLGDLGASATKQQLLAGWNTGTDIVYYAGHGSRTSWGSSTIFNNSDVSSLATLPVQPLVIQLDCLSSAGFMPAFAGNSLAEELLLSANKGARAVIGSTAFTAPESQTTLGTTIVNAMQNPAKRLGNAFLEGQKILANQNADPDVLNSFILMGDPAGY